MSWQTRVRALLVLVVLGLAGGITWYVMDQKSQAEAPPPVSPRTDDKATTEIAGGTLSRANPDGKPVFVLKYDKLLQYPTSVRLVKVAGTTMRGAQPVEFSADEADIKLKAGDDIQKFDEIVMRGHVVVKSAPGPDALRLETSEATYNDLTGIMTTEKPVKMQRGAMSGSGTGATLDRDRAVVWLLADAKVSLATPNQGTLDVTAGRAGLAENDKYFRFEENVRMEREGRLIETDAAIANLTADGKGITALELRGKSRIRGGRRGDGGVPNMNADDITITYGAESGVLERAVLMRNARLDLPEGGRRSLAAGFIDLGFAADGTLTALAATEAVEVKIPAERDLPAREVRAPKLDASGAAPKGLDRAEFAGGVEFREQAAARGSQAAIDRVGRSDTLTLALDGGFSRITTADFAGKAVFRDKDTTGEAPHAQYSLDRRQLTLRGGSAIARVTQEDGTIDAKDIDLTLDPHRLIAKGSVRSTLKPGAKKDRKEARPSILEDDDVVNVTAASLDYDGVSDRAIYSGDARLWQGANTVIQAATIVLDDKTGNLEARKDVRGIFVIEQEPQAGEKRAPAKPTTVRGDELIYDEARRRVMFRGTATQGANMQGPEGDITGQRIEIFVREDGNTLDRAEAYDKVTARLEGNRVATGTSLRYDARTRRYDMTGKPLVVTREFIEKGQTRCEKIEGATLTFERSTDNFRVEAANGTMGRTVPIPCTAK